MLFEVEMSCGHKFTTSRSFEEGLWISCWAVMHPAPGCQAQRKVTRVRLAEDQTV